MDQIVTALSALGPWGPLVGAAILLIVQRLKAKYPDLIPVPVPQPTPQPKPEPTPVPPAPPVLPDRPVLNALLKALLAALAASAVKRGVPVEEVVAEKVQEVEGS